MPPVRRERPAIRRPALGPKAPALGSVPVPAPAPALALNNDLFQEFMRTCIEKVQAQASAAPAAPAPDVEAKDDTDKPLKPRNPDLYYGNSYMECYYFCQQYKDHFEVARSLGHKRVLFAARFLKNCILNWWQQYKTRMQCNWLAPITWDEFKAFLRKSLGKSNAFVGHV